MKFNNFKYTISLTFFVFAIWYFLLGFSFINQPFIWDDLHIIRQFSYNEILSSWFGNWDPDSIETPSYRPIAILFYSFLGTVFKENFIALRIFIFCMMAFLLIQFLLMLLELNFKKLEITILAFLLVFTKIFSTLLSWFTLSALIFCYILAFFSVSYFIKWINTNNIKYYFLSILFTFLSIFTREEMYILPIILFFVYFYIKKNLSSRILINLLFLIPFFSIVLIHIVLRKYFVPESAGFEFFLWGVKFGGDNIGFGNLIKALKSSWSPMGYWKKDYSFLLIQTYSFFIWVFSIIIGIFFLLKNENNKINFIKSFIFIFLLIALCLPHVATERAFGIFLPTLISITFVGFLVSELIRIGKLKNNIFNMPYLICFLILSSGIFGGYDRSNKHIKTMNIFSEHIIYYDATFIYGYKNLKIPEARLKQKIIHLKKIGISDENDYKNFSYDKITKYDKNFFKPLSF